MSKYLMIDFGSTFTKLVAVDTEKEDIIATAAHFTTVVEDITIGYNNALKELYKKIGEEIKFDKLGTFMYSKEDGTPASKLKEQVHHMTKKSRYKKIMSIQKAISKKNLEEKLTKLKTSLEYFDEIINAKEPSRIILQMIIDKIYIHRDKTIRFKLKTDIEKMI